MKTIDIRVNEALIKKYDPCPKGVVNFNKHYTDISIKTLINSSNISYGDKIWLLKQIVPSELMVLWSIDSAFAAYEYSPNVIYRYSCDFAFNASNDATFADYAANNIVIPTDDTPMNVAGYAISAANYAVDAAKCAVDAADFYDKDNAQNERLQALLYLIENEG